MLQQAVLSKSALEVLGLLELRALWDQDLTSQREGPYLNFQPSPQGFPRQLCKHWHLINVGRPSSRPMAPTDKAAFLTFTLRR